MLNENTNKKQKKTRNFCKKRRKETFKLLDYESFDCEQLYFNELFTNDLSETFLDSPVDDKTKFSVINELTDGGYRLQADIEYFSVYGFDNNNVRAEWMCRVRGPYALERRVILNHLLESDKFSASRCCH